MKRIVDVINREYFQTSELIVLSNYFTSKIDPQRGVNQSANDFNYIKNWYQSIIKNQLNGVVFHDGLEKEFIQKYQTEKVIFLECKLGLMSLNDERFFVFHEFLNFVNDNSYILITDINDVVVLRSPLDFFSNSPKKIFLGRDDHYSWRSGYWSLNKIKEFQIKTSIKIPSYFLCFPVFNAGLIGGKVTVINSLLSKMISILIEMKDSGNYNMVVLNWVLFNGYYKSKKYLFIFGLLPFDVFWKINFSMRKGKLSFLRSLFKEKISKNEEGVINSKLLYSGFPFNSLFKKFQHLGNTKAYLIHK